MKHALMQILSSEFEISFFFISVNIKSVYLSNNRIQCNNVHICQLIYHFQLKKLPLLIKASSECQIM